VSPVAPRAAQPAHAPSSITHYLGVGDLSAAELIDLLDHAQELKRDLARGHAPTLLPGKVAALVFQKPSLRTRVSFEVAARELGGDSLYLSPQEVGLGARESIADVARVLSSYAHAVVLRTFRHEVAEEFARSATIPVINGLTDQHHPCQGLADVFTIAEAFGSTAGRTLAYVGDGNNVAHSLVQAAAKGGMRIHVATPPGHEPDAAIIEAARQDAELAGGRLRIMHDVEEAVLGADVVYTDVWTSMGQEAERALRSQEFARYQLNARLLALASPDCILLHPLPAHRGEEVTDDALDGPHSRVFVQAENRLHVQKAVLEWLLGCVAQDRKAS
jgi:ornithine carbamoyltransferase